MYVDASGKAPRELSALGVPTTLLIDRDGNEVGRLAGPAEWDSPEMVVFIHGYIEQQAGAALGRASDEVQLAFDADAERSPTNRGSFGAGQASFGLTHGWSRRSARSVKRRRRRAGARGTTASPQREGVTCAST